ncbi:MAG TPA: T9SS type A sorting domain-containing protein [bacterium (Candidatus Stahlbacteria)]|nr:T9SS type A sorting domain-containing protein [Candidatus Stahlbacteria bacterium]
MKTILLFWILPIILALSLCDMSWSVSAPMNQPQQGLVFEERPTEGVKVHTIGRVWSAVSNFGTYGDPTWVLPGYDWPGGTGVFYLWEGRLWIGATVDGKYYVSHADYGNYELAPSVDGDWIIKKPGKSMHDIECKYDDWYDLRNDKARQLGLKIIQRAMAWSIDGYNDFIAYEYKITYNADNSFHKKDTLKDVYVAWIFDDDSGGRISARSWLDDLTSYDGWTNGEWDRAYPEDTYPYDKVTLNPDGTIIPEPDGIWDQITIFGDDPEERTIHGETLYLWRNISYCYDGEDPQKPGDDEGEFGRAPGYLGGRVLYAPPSTNDSVWVDEYGDTCRMIRPYSHQWWNWANDPPTDDDKYLYMIGKHPFSRDKRFMGHPFDWGADVFDYRFMHTYGPYKIANHDTLEFVFAGLMGFGLNGGYGYGKGAEEGIFEEGKWYPGIRYTADQALKAYYMGSTHSDPAHPSSPSEDIHWLIPAPPEVPYLEYSAGLGVVTLAWTDIAERTPDPIDGEYDFRGYRIYRCEFRVRDWKLIKGFVDAKFAEENPESFPTDIYEYIEDGIFPHTYVDTNVIYGIPYFYAVTAFDAGRASPPAPIAVPSLESGKTNYKKTEIGAEVPIYVKTDKEMGLDKVAVAPNPYIGSERWERKYENKIQFMNLPGTCRIRIYTVTGDLVKEIEHTDGTGDEYWDLLSRNNQDVVSGLYIYKIEAWDERGNSIYKIGKFVIVR